MSAVNYARNRNTREIVFLEKGDVPSDELLAVEWAWFQPPVHPRGREVMLIGESTVNWQDRMRVIRADRQTLRH